MSVICSNLGCVVLVAVMSRQSLMMVFTCSAVISPIVCVESVALTSRIAYLPLLWMIRNVGRLLSVDGNQVSSDALLTSSMTLPDGLNWNCVVVVCALASSAGLQCIKILQDVPPHEPMHWQKHCIS